MKIHDRILGQSILGGDEFIEWVTEEFLKGEKDRERPSLRKIHTYHAKDAILRVIEHETGKSIKTITNEKRMKICPYFYFIHYQDFLRHRL